MIWLYYLLLLLLYVLVADRLSRFIAKRTGWNFTLLFILLLLFSPLLGLILILLISSGKG